MTGELLDELPPASRRLLSDVLRRDDPFLLNLLEEGVQLSPAQLSVLDDVIGSAIVAAFGPDWEPTSDVLELEEMSRQVRRLAPVPPAALSPRERGRRRLPKPFDRYEEYGEIRPEGHRVRPLAPQPMPGSTDPVPQVPTRVTGYTSAALQRMAERGISRDEVEALIEGYAAAIGEARGPEREDVSE